jgi:hypothetical protein
MIGTAPTQSQPIATQNAVGTVEVAGHMDPVPANCGILAEPIEINPQMGAFIGSWPILLGIPNNSSQHTGVLSVPDEHTQTDERLPGWWATKMAWFVSQSYQGTVKVQGFNIKDDSPIYIDWHGDDLMTTAELDPKKTFSYVQGSEGWAFFPSIVWVSKAGCYRFEAEWNGGAWRQIVAVGYVPIP